MYLINWLCATPPPSPLSPQHLIVLEEGDNFFCFSVIFISFDIFCYAYPIQLSSFHYFLLLKSQFSRIFMCFQCLLLSCFSCIGSKEVNQNQSNAQCCHQVSREHRLYDEEEEDMPMLSVERKWGYLRQSSGLVFAFLVLNIKLSRVFMVSFDSCFFFFKLAAIVIKRSCFLICHIN